MTVRAHKPEFNFREKLKELDYSHVPYEKMPAGSVIQTKFVTRTSDISTSTLNSYTSILDMEFTPLFANSLIELYSDGSYGVQAGVDVQFRYVSGTVEIERTGRFIGNDSQAQDAMPSRNNWTHYYYPNSTETRHYYYQGWKAAGPSSGIVWFHTYGSAATTTFAIREIRQ
jgi:hypothetical protein